VILDSFLRTDYLVAEQYPAVNIITNSFHLKDYALFVDLIDLVIFVGNRKIFPVRSGFSKWQVAKKEISLMYNTFNVQTFGLWEMGNQVFKTEKDGFYGFSFEQPFVFISEEIG
jgi:thiamine pyrophosphokinase